MSKFDDGDIVIPQEDHWHYSYGKDNGQKDSIQSIEIGKKYIVQYTDKDDDVFLKEDDAEFTGSLIVNESCLLFVDESHIIDAEFEEVDSTTDSTYCTCGGPSEFKLFDSFSYYLCTSCGLEK